MPAVRGEVSLMTQAEQIEAAVAKVIGAEAKEAFLKIAHMTVLNERPVLRPGEVAELFGISVRTLENWRGQGRGPRYAKEGKIVVYFRRDVEMYLQNRAVRTIDAR